MSLEAQKYPAWGLQAQNVSLQRWGVLRLGGLGGIEPRSLILKSFAKRYNTLWISRVLYLSHVKEIFQVAWLASGSLRYLRRTFVYPFTAPATTPLTMYFCRNMNTTIDGRTAITMAVIAYCQSDVYWPTNV